MLRGIAGIEKARPHSEQHAVITNKIHKQKKSVMVTQKIVGHVNPSKTLIYEESPEEQMSSAHNSLRNSQRPAGIIIPRCTAGRCPIISIHR